MKYAIVLLLLFFSISLLAQYPDGGRKSRLGYATTGDGLIVQGDGAPNYTPSSLKNAYTYVDTTNNRVFYFAQGAWRKLSEVKYMNLQADFLAGALVDSLLEYEAMYLAVDLPSDASSIVGVQLPVTGLDSMYAGRIVRVAARDSSASYYIHVASSSPDGIAIGDSLTTSYILTNYEVVEFQLYQYADTIWQWRLINSSIRGSVGSGDDWGAQAVVTNTTLTGQGTILNLLSVNTDTFPTFRHLRDSIIAAYAYADALHADDLDKDTTNEIQTLSIAAQNIELSQGGGTIDITESAQDIVGEMVSSNTETGITVTYDDTGGKLNFLVTGAASQLQYYEFTRGAAVISCLAFDTTGTSFVMSSGSCTLVIPAGVKWWTVSIHGSDANILIQDFSVVVQTESTTQNQSTVASAKPLNTFIVAKNSTNTIPSGSSVWVYDEGSSPQRQIVGQGSGDVEIRYLNLKNAFDYWVINVSNQ